MKTATQYPNRATIRLTVDQLNFASHLGKNNVSKGIRCALATAYASKPQTKQTTVQPFEVNISHNLQLTSINISLWVKTEVSYDEIQVSLEFKSSLEANLWIAIVNHLSHAYQESPTPKHTHFYCSNVLNKITNLLIGHDSPYDKSFKLSQTLTALLLIHGITKTST